MKIEWKGEMSTMCFPFVHSFHFVCGALNVLPTDFIIAITSFCVAAILSPALLAAFVALALAVCARRAVPRQPYTRTQIYMQKKI